LVRYGKIDLAVDKHFLCDALRLPSPLRLRVRSPSALVEAHGTNGRRSDPRVNGVTAHFFLASLVAMGREQIAIAEI